MRLVYVADNGFSQKDGKFCFNAPNFAHVGHLSKYFDEFVFVARNDEYDKSSFEIDSKFPVHLFNKGSIRQMNKQLKEVIKTADAVICYGTNGYFASKIAKRLNKPVITYNGGDPYDFLISRGTFKGKVLAPIKRYMEKEKISNADYAHFCAQFLSDRYPTKGEVLICSGVSIELNENILEQRLKKINDKVEEKYTIGLIGHTKNNLKGIDTAIKAISELGDNFEIQIVGRGNHEQYDKLAETLGIKDRVKFLGTLKAGEEIFSWLDSVDMYIQPSLIEGLPRATIEAMSRACPSITTSAGALSNLIEEDFRIEFGDYQKLAKKIESFAKDNKLMEIQARRNFERSKEFADDIRNKKYDEFYGNIVKQLNKVK